MLTPKNWHAFQHYNKRNPPWIKIHKGLLEDMEFHDLPVASRALAPCLWLLASEHMDGGIRLTLTQICFRLRMSMDDLTDALKPLISGGFLIDASDVLAECPQSAAPETEGEAETKKAMCNPPSRAAGTKSKKSPSGKKGMTLGVYPPELQTARTLWSALQRDCSDPKVLGRFREDRHSNCATSRSHAEAVWEAWQTLRLHDVDGIRVTDQDILTAIQALAATKWEDASTGRKLSVPMLGSLLNDTLIKSALVATLRSAA